MNERLIGLNSEGAVKVWMNENFAFNGVAPTQLAPKWMREDLKIKHMVCSLFCLVEDRLEKSDKFKEFKREKELKLANSTFQESLSFLNNYARIHRMLVPTTLPDLLKWNSITMRKKEWLRTEERSNEPLTFKRTKFSPSKKKTPNKKKPLHLFATKG